MPSAGYQLACTLSGDMNTESMMASDLRYSGSYTFSIATTFPSTEPYYHIFAWSGIMSQWTTEEVEHEKIHDYGNGREYCRDDVWRHEEPHGNIQNPEHKEKQYKDVGAFSMYLHFIIEIF